MNKYLSKKIVDFVNYFKFTKEDVNNGIDFAYEAECEAESDECAYSVFYSLMDEIRIQYNTNNANTQLNELVTDYLTKL